MNLIFLHRVMLAHSYIYFKDLFETIHSVHLCIWTNTDTLCVWTNPSPDTAFQAFQSLVPAFSPIRFPCPHLPRSPAVCSPGGPHGL